MKAVIYARYSSDNQREESIEGQLRECMEYADYNDITVVDTYIDRALSAKTDNRPAFQQMIKDSSRHLFDLVIVWKLDRFARNRYDSAHYKAILKMALCNFRKIDTSKQDGKRKIIDTFINSIFLYDDHLKIIYNGNGKEETVTLEELESSTLFSYGAPISPKV